MDFVDYLFIILLVVIVGVACSVEEKKAGIMTRSKNLVNNSDSNSSIYIDENEEVILEPALKVQNRIEMYTSQGGGWRDMVGQITFIGSDINDPTRSSILSSGHQGYKFDIGKNFEVTYHLQHDYTPGTPIYFHVHWVEDGTDGATLGNPVTWLFHYVYSRGFGRGHFDFSADDDTAFVVTATESPIAPQAKPATPNTFDQLCHMTTEITLPVVNPLFEPDGIILLHLHRVGNGDAIPADASPDNNNGIFVLTADCHYQSNTFNTLNRQPNFYGP